MGICGSRVVDLSLLEGSKDVQALLCLEDVEVLRLCHGFHHACLTGNGKLSYDEWQLWMRFDDADRAVARRLFESYAEDSSGMSFRSFLIFTWNVAARDTQGIASLSFDLYDQRGMQAIDGRDVKVLMEDVFGSGWAGNLTATRVLASITGSASELGAAAAQIRRDDWLVRLSKSPILLLPLFRFQSTLKQRTGGNRFWARVEARRAALSSTGQLNAEGIGDTLNKARSARVTAARRASINASKPVIGASRRLSAGDGAIGASRRMSDGSASAAPAAPAPQAMLTFGPQHFMVSPRQAATSSEAGVKLPPPGAPGASAGRRTSITGFVMPPIVIPRSPLEKVMDGLSLAGSALVRPVTAPILRARDVYEGIVPGEAPGWAGVVGPVLGWVKSNSGVGSILKQGAGIPTFGSTSAGSVAASQQPAGSDALYAAHAIEEVQAGRGASRDAGGSGPGSAAGSGLEASGGAAEAVHPVRRASMTGPRRASLASRRGSLSQSVLQDTAGAPLAGAEAARKGSLSEGSTLATAAAQLAALSPSRRASLTLAIPDSSASGSATFTPHKRSVAGTPGGSSLALHGVASPSNAGSAADYASKPGSTASYDATTAGLLGALAATSPTGHVRASRRRSSAGDSTSIMMGAIGRTSSSVQHRGLSHHSTETAGGV